MSDQLTYDDLVILKFGLEDHLYKLQRLDEQRRRFNSSPNLALIDTRILAAKVESLLSADYFQSGYNLELVKAVETDDPASHPEHCLCDKHFDGLSGPELQAEVDRRVRLSAELVLKEDR